MQQILRGKLNILITSLEILLQIFKFANCFNTECYALMNIMFWGKQNLGTLTVSGFVSANINIGPTKAFVTLYSSLSTSSWHLLETEYQATFVLTCHGYPYDLPWKKQAFTLSIFQGNSKINVFNGNNTLSIEISRFSILSTKFFCVR